MGAIVRRQRTNPEKLKKAKELRDRMTRMEQILWEQLRGNRLNGLHFRRQQVVEGFIVDFYCHRVRLVVEVEWLIPLPSRFNRIFSPREGDRG